MGSGLVLDAGQAGAESTRGKPRRNVSAVPVSCRVSDGRPWWYHFLLQVYLKRAGVDHAPSSNRSAAPSLYCLKLGFRSRCSLVRCGPYVKPRRTARLRKRRPEAHYGRTTLRPSLSPSAERMAWTNAGDLVFSESDHFRMCSCTASTHDIHHRFGLNPLFFESLCSARRGRSLDPF